MALVRAEHTISIQVVASMLQLLFAISLNDQVLAVAAQYTNFSYRFGVRRTSA